MTPFIRGNTSISLAGPDLNAETWRNGLLMLSDMLSDPGRTAGFVLDAELRFEAGERVPKRLHRHGKTFHFITYVTALKE
jgi:hypothetical protein